MHVQGSTSVYISRSCMLDHWLLTSLHANHAYDTRLLSCAHTYQLIMWLIVLIAASYCSEFEPLIYEVISTLMQFSRVGGLLATNLRVECFLVPLGWGRHQLWGYWWNNWPRSATHHHVGFIFISGFVVMTVLNRCTAILRCTNAITWFQWVWHVRIIQKHTPVSNSESCLCG